MKGGQDGKARATDDPHYNDVPPTTCYVNVAAANHAGYRTAERFQEADVKKSILDNQDFITPNDFKKLSVVVDADTGEVDVLITPGLTTESDALTYGSDAALTASKALWTTYPEMQTLSVTVLGDFTDQYGKTSQGLAASLGIYRVTAKRFDYEGLKLLVERDNKLMFCDADTYVIEPAIYNKLKDKGCLPGTGK